ncbi:MAG: DMT family transporter [Candidatus Sericytochromatia bacterium]|nr:DMT family transporter [Candidatus Tanganyikabacteria bacterium]
MTETARGRLLVLGAALCWSFGGLGIKLVEADAWAIAGWRSLFALPVLALALHVFGGRGGRVPAAQVLRRPLVWAAAASYALMIVSFVGAAKLTTAANAIFLEYTAPIYVSLLSWRLLRERLRPVDWIAVASSVCGMALLLGEGVAPSAREGNLLGVVSGIAFAGLPLFLRLDQLAVARERGTAELAAVAPVWAIGLGNVLAVLASLPLAQHGPARPFDWVVLALLGVFQIGVAYLLYAAGVRRVRALEATLVAEIEPVLNPVWVALGTGEVPGGLAVAGGTLILGAVALQAGSFSKRAALS